MFRSVMLTVLFFLINLTVGYSQEWGGQLGEYPYGMSAQEWQRLQQRQENYIYNRGQSPVQKNTIITNGGFETGDFTGWITQDLTEPFVHLSVRQAGIDPGYGLFTSQPSEGLFSAIHGFNGSAPETIRMAQDVALPAGALTVEFNYRAGWDLLSFCNGCTGVNIFMMNIEPAGGGTALQSDTFIVAQPMTQVFDTGDLHGSIDVSSYAGSTIRISFDCFIEQAWTGPCFFQLDDVYVIESGSQAALNPNPANFANVAMATTDTLTGYIRNVGTQDLTVSNIIDPGGVFSLIATPSFPVVIAPGASEEIKLTFAPPDSGLFTATLNVESDDPNDPILNVPVMGRGVMVNHNVNLLAHLNDYSQIGYSDCWGYTAPNGDEYALLGVHHGVSIVNVSDPQAIAEVDFVPFVMAPPFGWYDMKTYQNYMYVSSEYSLSIQIVDLSPLPDSASVVGMFSGLTSEPHNLFVDSEAALLYVVEDFNFDPSVRIFSLADPVNPVEVSAINTAIYGADSHDVFAQDSVLYIAEGINPSIAFFDMSDPENPTLLTRLNIPAAGYVHNVWVSEDNQYMVTTEETPEMTVKVWDISDLNNISLISEYLGQSRLAHNAMIKANRLYISHYESGLKVVDFSDPTAVEEYGFYDTFIQSDYPDFNGAWGVYPFAQNGMLFISDIQSGLYVLQLEESVGIEDEKPKMPQIFSLKQSYPNPFNPTTTIEFVLSQAMKVKLTIYNSLGQEIATMFEGKLNAGEHRYTWDASNMPSGVYYYRLKSGAMVETRKMILIQ